MNLKNIKIGETVTADNKKELDNYIQNLPPDIIDKIDKEVKNCGSMIALHISQYDPETKKHKKNMNYMVRSIFKLKSGL